MKIIKEGKKNYSKEITAPCCESVLEVTPEDADMSDHNTYEFTCCVCNKVFYYSANYFHPNWSSLVK